MKIKRPLLKRYITILLDSDEIAKRQQVKTMNKLSDRKIYMAMIDALMPVAITPEIKDAMIDVLNTPLMQAENNGIVDEMPVVNTSEIIEEE